MERQIVGGLDSFTTLHFHPHEVRELFGGWEFHEVKLKS